MRYYDEGWRWPLRKEQRSCTMVRYNQETDKGALSVSAGVEPQVTIDAVCPKCFRPLPGPRMFDEPDRCGRELRKYLGFCPACNLGCEVIQFKRDGRWVIHRYQYYPVVDTAMHCVGLGKWVMLNEMPEPAPIVLGPGGEYDKQIYPVGLTPGVELLTKLRKALEALCQTIECLMRGPGL